MLVTVWLLHVRTHCKYQLKFVCHMCKLTVNISLKFGCHMCTLTVNISLKFGCYMCTHLL